MTDDIVERLRTREMMAMILKNKPNLYKDAADEIDRLRKYEELVRFIANDYHELSHDKAQWQRDDWKKRCKKLLQEEALTEPEKGFEDYNFGNLEF